MISKKEGEMSRRRFLKILALATTGLSFPSAGCLEKELDNGEVVTGVSYQEFLPRDVALEIDSKIVNFGWQKQIEDLDKIVESNGMFYAKIDPNIGDYDCFVSTRRITDILKRQEKKLTESIDGYKGFQIMEGMDNLGISAQHRWIEVVVKRKGRYFRLPIDCNPPYREGISKAHIGSPVNASPDINMINLSGEVIIGVKNFEGRDYIRLISIKNRPQEFIQYLVIKVPKKPGEYVEQQVVFLHPYFLTPKGYDAVRVSKVRRKFFGGPTADVQRISPDRDLFSYLTSLDQSLLQKYSDLYNNRKIIKAN